jgi:hypothetical protein
MVPSNLTIYRLSFQLNESAITVTGTVTRCMPSLKNTGQATGSGTLWYMPGPSPTQQNIVINKILLRRSKILLHYA